MGHLQLEWVRSMQQNYYEPMAGFLLREYSSNAAHPLPPKSLWNVDVGVYILCMVQFDPLPFPPGKSKISSLRFYEVHVFSRTVYTKAVTCEQALLFGRVKWAAQVRVSERRSRNKSLLAGYDGCGPQDYVFLRKNAGVCGRVVGEE